MCGSCHLDRLLILKLVLNKPVPLNSACDSFKGCQEKQKKAARVAKYDTFGVPDCMYI